MPEREQISVMPRTLAILCGVVLCGCCSTDAYGYSGFKLSNIFHSLSLLAR